MISQQYVFGNSLLKSETRGQSPAQIKKKEAWVGNENPTLR